MGATISAEATDRTQGMSRGGIISPHNLNRYNCNQTCDNQTSNNHTSRIDHSRPRTDTEAKGAAEDEVDPEGNGGLIATDSKIIDPEANGNRDTTKDNPPQPRLVRSQTDQEERGSK